MISPSVVSVGWAPEPMRIQHTINSAGNSLANACKPADQAGAASFSHCRGDTPTNAVNARVKAGALV